jgi:hypothetical protein
VTDCRSPDNHAVNEVFSGMPEKACIADIRNV